MQNNFNVPLSYESEYKPFIIPTVHKRSLIISDTHVPYHNFSAVCSTLDFCQDKNIDSILINGDFLDMHHLSKFQHDPRKRSFKDEIQAGNEMLDCLVMAFPTAKIFLKWGNHDERYEKWLMVKAPEIFGVEEYRLENHLKTLVRGVTVIADQKVVYMGKLPVLHGHEINMKNTSVNPARTLFLRVKHSAICSHLHVPSQHSGKRIDGHVITCWSTGHLSEEHPEYARNNEWIPGFCIVDYDKEQFEVSNYKIIHNKVYRT